MRRFLNEDLPRQREADKLAGEESDGRILTPGDNEWDTYRRLLSARSEVHRAEHAQACVENELKLVICSADGLDGIATWKSHPRQTFDAMAFRRVHPEQYREFVVEKRYRSFNVL